MVFAGGIDVGGTKIEAKLFSEKWDDLDKRRINTPKDTYENLLHAIEEQFLWLQKAANGKQIPIGIGVPGLIERDTGRAVIANLPANGKSMRKDLGLRVGREVWFENDCRAFALSEAILGAGRGYETVFGLVIGTGVAGGFVAGGELVRGQNGAAGEIGHLPIPAAIATAHNLPILDCGCGRKGCYETLVSGPGMTRLAIALTGKPTSSMEISAGARDNDPLLAKVMDIWTELVVSLIQTAILVVDPDCIVLGGGLSNIPGVENRLMARLPVGMLNGATPPLILLAEGGDSSGARGAALVAHSGSLAATLSKPTQMGVEKRE